MTANVVRLPRAPGGGGRDRDPSAGDELPEGCPVLPIGYDANGFHFLNYAGMHCRLSDTAIGREAGLVGLFHGHREWLCEHFPLRIARTRVVGGETIDLKVEKGFDHREASAALMRACNRAGQFGPHVEFRGPGIWADGDGDPIVHMGDCLYDLADGSSYKPGRREGDVVWVVGRKWPRPAAPATADIGQGVVDGFRQHWNWRSTGGPVMIGGLLVTKMLGAALQRWRPSGFVIGPAQAGKTLMIEAFAAGLPMHQFTNNTTASGVMGLMDNQAMPVIIDEAGEHDPENARKLMDIALASTNGRGMESLRGDGLGGVRKNGMRASFLYGATAPPPMAATHLGRIAIIELDAAPAGAYGRDDMEAFADHMRSIGPALWGRSLAAWPRWAKTAQAFADGLRRLGCAPREIDQHSAILAGHHVLTQDGLPTAVQVRAGIAAITDFVRLAEDIRDDSDSRQVTQFLLSRRVQYDGSTRQDTIGHLLDRAWSCDGYADPRLLDSDAAIRALGAYGLRPVRGWEEKDSQGRRIPRNGRGDGLWVLPVALNNLFVHSPWDAGRWQIELLRLPGAARSRTTVRILGVPGKPIWLPRGQIDLQEPISFQDLVAALDIPIPPLLAMIDRPGFPIASRGNRSDGRDDLIETWTFDLDRVTAWMERQENADDG